MKQVICMKWGDKYPADYVNKLYGMVCRNLPGEFRFVCLTDDASGIRAEVECRDCPSVAIPAPYRELGWRKLSLWAERLPGMSGVWLYLDLDVVITGDLSEFFDYEPAATFIVMHNWSQPGKRIGNTSVYRFLIGSHPYLHQDLLQGHAEILKRFPNSQTYISRTIRSISFWPDEWCVLFKTHCVPPMPARWWRAPGLPPTARVVAFPGVPNPDEAVLGLWPAKWYKRFYKHIRPARWISTYWRE